MSFRLRFSETANGLLKYPFLPSPSYNLLLSPSFTLLQERAEKCSCQSSCNVKFRRFDDLSLWHIMLDNSLLHHETGPLKTHEMHCSSPKCDWLSHRGLVAINITAIYRELVFFPFLTTGCAVRCEVKRNLTFFEKTATIKPEGLIFRTEPHWSLSFSFYLEEKLKQNCHKNKKCTRSLRHSWAARGIQPVTVEESIVPLWRTQEERASTWHAGFWWRLQKADATLDTVAGWLIC